MDEEEVNKWNDLNKEEVTVKISCDTVVKDVADRDTVIEEVTECMRTPRPTLYEQNETPGGSIYWKPHVEGIPIPVEGTYYDTIDEALDMYTKYAEMAGFEVKKGGQRYNMKFVPFIGIDNHGKCVTLGSGMILHKDTQSYMWLLTAFMTAFLKEPTMIVTDQDGAMKRDIEAVFKKAKHRLYMWHIMQKIPSMIPAYFIDSLLYGLMRTTSRSESENSFFKSFTSPGATLVSFMMSYESAMERQSKDEEKMGTYVENMKKLLDEVKADMPNPPSRDTGDVIGGIFSITKPDQIGVQNPTKAVNKGEHLKKGERLKSEREKALTVAKKK
ncbi:FAR1-related sequence 5-like protein, partial [Tanacetum coccineum]